MPPQARPPRSPYWMVNPGAKVTVVPANPMAITPTVLIGTEISLPARTKSEDSFTQRLLISPAERRNAQKTMIMIVNITLADLICPP
jgi:hypothetical protein